MSMHRRPRIGITLGPERMAEYERAVEAGGGEPIALAHDLARVATDLAAIDALVLSGGADVDPAHFGEARHPSTELATPERDAYELALARAAYDAHLPTLAICRGIQVANVAFGGSLHQHVPDVAGDGIPHAPEGDDGRTLRGLIDAHVVSIEPDARLAALVGTRIVTGSRHHQALRRVADPFRAVAHAPDGIVEAIEARDTTRFWLGVQWHPESTLDLDDGASRAIFRALVAAAAG
jgi:putative glutamine amidotransferase